MTTYRYDIEQNGVGLAMAAIALSPLVLLMFGYVIEWWNG